MSESLVESFRKVRKSWGNISPVEKIIPNKKKKSRKKLKQELKASELFY